GERPQVRPARGARRFGRRDARRAVRGRAREGARAHASAGDAARILGRDALAPVVTSPKRLRPQAAAPGGDSEQKTGCANSPKRRAIRQRLLWVLGLGATAAVVAASGASSDPGGLSLTSVPNPNTSSTGYAPPNILSPELSGIVVAQGATRAEYPDPSTVSYYGYDNDKLNPAGQPVMVPAGGLAEAHKTEPDKNTYLVFKHGLAGSDSNYDYGTHFLFQGHESGTPGSITRINLDADAAHRVTVLATKDSSGASIATIDGSTWDPSAKRLLFTTEGASRPPYAATPDYPSTVTDVSGSLGRGGYEGIQNDSAGDIWIVEDVSGDVKAGASFAKRPNSFVYRYTPSHPGDLEHGKLEALQVRNGSGAPITWASQAALNAPDEVALYAYGNTFRA